MSKEIKEKGEGEKNINFYFPPPLPYCSLSCLSNRTCLVFKIPSLKKSEENLNACHAGYQHPLYSPSEARFTDAITV